MIFRGFISWFMRTIIFWSDETPFPLVPSQLIYNMLYNEFGLYLSRRYNWKKIKVKTLCMLYTLIHKYNDIFNSIMCMNITYDAGHFSEYKYCVYTYNMHKCSNYILQFKMNFKRDWDRLAWLVKRFIRSETWIQPLEI